MKKKIIIALTIVLCFSIMVIKKASAAFEEPIGSDTIKTTGTGVLTALDLEHNAFKVENISNNNYIYIVLSSGYYFYNKSNPYFTIKFKVENVNEMSIYYKNGKSLQGNIVYRASGLTLPSIYENGYFTYEVNVDDLCYGSPYTITEIAIQIQTIYTTYLDSKGSLEVLGYELTDRKSDYTPYSFREPFPKDTFTQEDIDKSYNDGMADGWQAGNDEGYEQGWNEGEREGYNDGCVDGYQDGYDVGYDEGIKKGEEVNANLGDMFLNILDSPRQAISNILNFEFLGINLASLVFFLITAILVVVIIKFFI